MEGDKYKGLFPVDDLEFFDVTLGDVTISIPLLPRRVCVNYSTALEKKYAGMTRNQKRLARKKGGL